MTTTGTTARDPLAVLAAMKERAEAATSGPWITEERHGTSITDEAWAGVRIISVPDGETVAFAYLPDLLEPDEAEENCIFIAAARSDMPALLAVAEAALKAAGEWERQAEDLAGQGCTISPHERRECASTLRSVIAAALLGEEVPAS